MKNLFSTRLLAGLAWLGAAVPGVAQAAPFTPGNLVVVRVGDGTTATPALSSTATTTYLLEYTPGGTLVQTIALPTATVGTNAALTNTGSSSSDALLTRSADGRYLIITGYDAAPGTATITNTAATANNRVIGRVAADGTVDTSTRLGDAFGGTASTAVNIRSAASPDGSYFYAVGSSGGVRYVPFANPAATATVLISATPANNRGAGVFGGNLYVSSSTSSGGFYGLTQIGAGLPTTAGQTGTLLPGFPSAAPTSGTTPSSYGFYFADLSATVPGVDVAYVADDRAAPDGGLQKWSLVGGTWRLNGTVTGVAARGVNGSTTGTTVALAVSGAAGLYLLSDNAGYNAAPSSTVFPMALATPGTNSSFRGVAFAPVAAAVAAPTITSFTPTTGGPGTTVTVTGTNLTGATAVRIGSFAVPNFTVVNATTITLVVPGGTGSVNGLVSVMTPGGTATSAVPFNLVSATLAANGLPGLTVFPNPATDRLTLELPNPAPATVALRDLAGRLVLAPAVLGADHQVQLPASLARGTYLLEIRQGSTLAVRRIARN
ncbi:IPT/TIG domain-containing protein [Hymenobacter sp. UYCo722]|uniref:T9SS type A sorting domain-containing protein n=1 Tax=Hymenobacter sp. UYCo722 TaxID=3156335 RepID=UPI00339B9DA2